jgi:hypothetical protein
MFPRKILVSTRSAIGSVKLWMISLKTGRVIDLPKLYRHPVVPSASRHSIEISPVGASGTVGVVVPTLLPLADTDHWPKFEIKFVACNNSDTDVRIDGSIKSGLRLPDVKLVTSEGSKTIRRYIYHTFKYGPLLLRMVDTKGRKHTFDRRLDGTSCGQTIVLGLSNGYIATSTIDCRIEYRLPNGCPSKGKGKSCVQLKGTICSMVELPLFMEEVDRVVSMVEDTTGLPRSLAQLSVQYLLPSKRPLI